MAITNTGKVKGKRYCCVGDDKIKFQLSRLLSSIITRCYSPKHKCYHNYGGRGIKVCDEWIGNGGLDNFYNWAISAGFTGEKNEKGYNVQQIDRIDNCKGYSPENCRWATKLEQANNTKTNLIVEYRGEKDSLANWCRKLNLPYMAVFLRIHRRKWGIERAFETPIKGR